MYCIAGLPPRLPYDSLYDCADSAHAIRPKIFPPRFDRLTTVKSALGGRGGPWGASMLRVGARSLPGSPSPLRSP